MKFFKIALVCLAFGVIFVFFPRGQQNMKLRGDCDTNICVDWYSPGININISGIPFRTILDSESLELIDNPDIVQSNELKIAGNFLIGSAVGFAIIKSIPKLRKPKKP